MEAQQFALSGVASDEPIPALPHANVASRSETVASLALTEGSMTGLCKCGKMQIVKRVKKEGSNNGRLFASCDKCKFYQWISGDISGNSNGNSSSSSSGGLIFYGEASQPPPLLRIYTDGACKGNSNVHSCVCPAGFGVVIYRHEDNSVVDEIFGPVELDDRSPFFMHATVGSNNTAELTALGECLLWIRDFAPLSQYQGPIQVLYDSEYAMKSISGEYNGAKNAAMIAFIRTLYRALLSVRPGGLLQFKHVKGHSNDTGNDRADSCAGRGAAGERCSVGRYSNGSVRKREAGDEAEGKASKRTVVDLTLL